MRFHAWSTGTWDVSLRVTLIRTKRVRQGTSKCERQLFSHMIPVSCTRSAREISFSKADSAFRFYWHTISTAADPFITTITFPLTREIVLPSDPHSCEMALGLVGKWTVCNEEQLQSAIPSLLCIQENCYTCHTLEGPRICIQISDPIKHTTLDFQSWRPFDDCNST